MFAEVRPCKIVLVTILIFIYFYIGRKQGGVLWFRRGYVVPRKRVEGTYGPALKNYWKHLNANENSYALAA